MGRANVGSEILLRNVLNFVILPFHFDRRLEKLNHPMDVVQGTLDLLILKALSLEPMHAWGISSRIKRMSADAFEIGQGSLYPAVHRLEDRGWIISIWRTTENNRIARYYELTAVGRHALTDEVARWRECAGAVERVIDAR